MPESSTEIEELRRRVEQQAQRIDELQDALHTLSVAVQYREEEPYLASWQSTASPADGGSP